MQIKYTLGFSLNPVRLATVNKTKTNKYWCVEVTKKLKIK